jgi:hypothetical protein
LEQEGKEDRESDGYKMQRKIRTYYTSGTGKIKESKEMYGDGLRRKPKTAAGCRAVEDEQQEEEKVEEEDIFLEGVTAEA